MPKSAATRKPGRPATRPGPRMDHNRRCDAGVIRGDEIYSMTEICVRLEQGQRTIRGAMTEGLRSMFFGKRLYFHGADVIEFLKSREVIRKPRED